VKVVGVNCLSHRFHTEFVDRSISSACIDAATGQPLRIALRIVVAPVTARAPGRSAELRSPDHQR
jgi:hypothetical protein